LSKQNTFLNRCSLTWNYKHDVGFLTLVTYSRIYPILQFGISGCDTQ